MKHIAATLLAVVAAAFFASAAEQPLIITPLAEKKVTDLPAGELFWRIEKCANTNEARAAAGRWSLVAESANQVWLFTLSGNVSANSPGEKRDAVTVGPIPRPKASEYLLRINEATGSRGSITPVHTHPGSEAFFVLTGEQTVRNVHTTMTVKAGETEAGCGADTPMQVSSTGAADLHALVMFVVDAHRPFAPAATFP